MIVILDANILLRLAQEDSPQNIIAKSAIENLQQQKAEVRTIPQSIYEFWVAATRPVANNGLGAEPAATLEVLKDFMTSFPVIGDPSNLFSTWLELVSQTPCRGKVAHDARIIAAMKLHDVKHLMTFNIRDFQRFPDITILDPNILASPSV
jgi:predicted nucleic acid-binding protein